MIIKRKVLQCLAVVSVFAACSKSSDVTPTPAPTPTPIPLTFSFTGSQVDGISNPAILRNVNFTPSIKFSFNAKVDHATVPSSLSIKDVSGVSIAYNTSYTNNDSAVLISPVTPLSGITKYTVALSTTLKSQPGGTLTSGTSFNLITKIDSTRKFPAISDNALLDLVQAQTFKYFWDFGHPVSGLARERNTSGETITSGGSGFGIMALVTGISRNFITRAQGLARMQTMVAFLKNTAQTFHGAYPHWLNGTTGVVIPFSAQDNGADLVETSYLMQGLLTARQYFNGADPAETALRADINTIWNRVEWDWFTQGQNTLYWHWSPTGGFTINMQIKGWNECLITYVLAKSSSTHAIPTAAYTTGWASNGGPSFINNNSYYTYQLPLGPNLGGPLFFEHYSFLGINPTGLADTYANYATQTKNHTLINYNYCRANPQGYYGYSDSTWGLTASDIPNGYAASSPANDLGVIAPTAALSSFPYTPTESMKALKFYYYVLGDKIFKQYGFTDAFKLHDPWFADSFLAIDQGPIIVQMENYRSGLLWNLFTSCPEVKAGMVSLGFTAPYLP